MRIKKTQIGAFVDLNLNGRLLQLLSDEKCRVRDWTWLRHEKEER